MIVEVEEKERYQLYRIRSHLIQIVVVATKHCMILMMFQSYSWWSIRKKTVDWTLSWKGRKSWHTSLKMPMSGKISACKCVRWKHSTHRKLMLIISLYLLALGIWVSITLAFCFFFLLNHDLSSCLKAFKCSLFIKPLHHSPHCYSPSLTNLPFRSLSLWVVYDPCLIIFSYKFQLKWAHKQNCFFQESRLLLTPSSSGYAAGGRGKAKIGHCPGYHMTYM